MSRYDELMQAVCPEEADRTLYGQLVAEFVQLEERMDYLRTLPQIKVHPSDPTKQKTTPAHKQYKELLQQYTNIAKILARYSGAENDNDDSPLRAWARARMETNAY